MKILIVLAVTLTGAWAQTSTCLDCICGIESSDGTPGCGTITDSCDGYYGCNIDSGSCSCGPYQIKDPYFTDCSDEYVPIDDWQDCATDDNCARTCVQNYFDRYGTYCTDKDHDEITCEEFGGIHNGGPLGCDASSTADYRQKVTECCNNAAGSC